MRPRSLVKESECGYSVAVSEKLYYRDPYLFEFDAVVARCTPSEGGPGVLFDVLLDRTCFYPGGGGQPSDRGTLGGANVVDVAYRGEEIAHVVDAALPPGGAVRGAVDAGRRLDFMAQHTGQHILSQALLAVGGLETVSVHFGDDITTIELKAASVEERTLRIAEERANAVVKENRPVIVHEVDAADVSRFPLRRTPPDVGKLRVVEVSGFDWAACGGVHVAASGEVLLVKILSVEKIRGRVRVLVKMGRRALEDYGRKTALVQDLARALTCGEADILARVEELLRNGREAAAELRKLRAERAIAAADECLLSARSLGSAALVSRIFEAAGPEYLKAFVDRVTAAPGRIVIAADRSPDGFQWIVAHSLADPGLLECVPPLLAIADAKGGGRGGRMQGAGRKLDAIPAFVDAIERELERRLG